MSGHRPSERPHSPSEPIRRPRTETDEGEKGRLTTHAMANLRRVFMRVLPPALRGMTRFWDEELGFMAWYEPESKRLTVCGLRIEKEARRYCLHDRITRLDKRDTYDFMLFLKRLHDHFEKHPGEWDAATVLRLHDPSGSQIAILKIWPGRFQPRG